MVCIIHHKHHIQATGLRVQLSEGRQKLHTVALEWSQAKLLLSAREKLVEQLEALAKKAVALLRRVDAAQLRRP